jgi:hypothetical protein
VELLGGTMSIDSAVGKGTRVTITLPASRPAGVARPSTQPEPLFVGGAAARA